MCYKMSTTHFKLGIIGCGFVGKAAALFGLPTHKVECKMYDIDPEKCVPVGTTLVDLKDSDLIFICLPTPMNKETGECYTGLIEKCLKQVRETLGDSIDIVIRSTVPVGFSEKNRCHFVPEFLTEKNWYNDILNCKEWFIGVDDNSNNVIEKFEKLFQNSFSDVKRVYLTTKVCESIKYFRNCFLATKVSFCNEFYQFCKASDVEYEIVRKYATTDTRIGSSHASVGGSENYRGYGGTCFPKDMASLKFQMKEKGVESKIISAAEERNTAIDRPEKDWMLDVGRAAI
jgi:UDPglucose 6-dehydrogenase